MDHSKFYDDPYLVGKSTGVNLLIIKKVELNSTFFQKKPHLFFSWFYEFIDKNIENLIFDLVDTF